MRALRQALRVTPEEQLELARLSRTERRAELNARRRERVLSLLRQEEFMSGERLESLSKLSPREFFSRVRELADSLGRKPHSARRPSKD